MPAMARYLLALNPSVPLTRYATSRTTMAPAGTVGAPTVTELFAQGSGTIRKAAMGCAGALGGVFVGLRISEVHQRPVAQVLGDVPRGALDRLRRRLLIGAHESPRSQNITVSWRRGESWNTVS